MKNFLPKVTIGMCVRNCEKTIEDAIKSVLNQSYPHHLMELVFVDDASVDKTSLIIQDYTARTDIKAKIFFHKKWRGLGPSRNLVFQNASGKYIIWVDGDMIIEKDFVKKQVEFMENHPEIGIAKGKYGVNLKGKLAGDLQNLEFVAVNSAGDSVPLGTGGAIYRIEALKEVGGFNDNMSFACEDVEVECRVKQAGWLLARTNAIFYEKPRGTWKELWREYMWQGKGYAFLTTKRHTFSRRLFWPPILLLVIVSRSINAYKLTRRLIAFLLPIQYIFKRAAWIYGFFKGKLEIVNGG